VADDLVVVVPLGVVGLLDPLFVGLEVRRALRTRVSVSKLSKAFGLDNSYFEGRSVNFEAVALRGVFVAAVELGDIAGSTLCRIRSAGSNSAASIVVIVFEMCLLAVQCVDSTSH